MHAQVRTERPRRLKLELQTLQPETRGIYRGWSKGNAGQARADRSASTYASRGARTEGVGTRAERLPIRRSLEIEVIYEWIVLANVWAVPLVFKGVEEQSPTATNY